MKTSGERTPARKRQSAAVILGAGLVLAGLVSGCGAVAPGANGTTGAVPGAEATATPQTTPASTSGSTPKASASPEPSAKTPSGPISSLVPQTTPTGTALDEEYSPTAVLEGNEILLTTWGSSTCPTTVKQDRVEGMALILTLAAAPTGACTADLAAHVQRIELDKSLPAEVTNVILDQPGSPQRIIRLER